MPTPVNVARQCLTPDAAHALDEAVTVARRRGHAQTTSLHAVSALLSLPSSTLRDACARARNTAYSPRLQFKALELCLSVSLDRVPSSQLNDNNNNNNKTAAEPPPVSNSLMAAIKRSQANQRRQPENYHLYHHQQTTSSSSSSSSSSISCVKVELQHLILSILDDPVVSRVFGEAGFRSSEIKLAIIRPLPQLLRYNNSDNNNYFRSRGPPLFLCSFGNNLTENPDFISGPVMNNPGPSPRGGFKFPFPGFAGGLFKGGGGGGVGGGGGDYNLRRISEALVRKNKGRNPLLVGVCAYDTLASFINNLVDNNSNNTINNNRDNKNDNVFSLLSGELSGVKVVSIENEVKRSITLGNSDQESVSLSFDEVGKLLEQQSMSGGGGGLVVNYGDLKVFVSDDSDGDNVNINGGSGGGGVVVAVSEVVAQLTNLLQVYSGKVRLIGAVATYETYLKFVSRFPSIEKDWDLQLLPFSSLRPSSLMESFVPFGGFFSTPSEFKSPLSNPYKCVTRCHLCNEKCEQEVIAVSNGRNIASVADQYQSCLPSWLQMTELGTNTGLDVKTRDDGVVLRAKIAGLQRKWDNICLRLHHRQPFHESNTYQVGSQLANTLGCQLVEHKMENADNHGSSNANESPTENNCMDLNSCIPIDLQTMSTSQSKQREKTSKGEDLLLIGIMTPCSLSNSSIDDGSRTSPASVTSVTTGLGLGICSAPTSNEVRDHATKNCTELPQHSPVCTSANVDVINGNISDNPAQSSSSSCHDFSGQYDSRNFKTLFRALIERVGWQDQAIRIISHRIANCRMTSEKLHGGSSRGGIWFNFTGPDRCGKKEIAIALAEIVCGSRENFIFADLSSQGETMHKYAVSNQQEVSAYDANFRGKTLVDYVAGELWKKPLSVVFLENVDKADVLAKSSLSLAIRTGKFSDSHGREASTNNAIFVTTSTFAKDNKILCSREESPNYSEERILRAQSWSMQLLVEHALGDDIVSQDLTLSVSNRRSSSILVNKRKLLGRNENPEQHDISEMAKRAHKTSSRTLDLNLPAEENEVHDANDGNCENDFDPENNKAWLQDFHDQTVTTVVFKPFDFDALAEKILNDMKDSFHKIAGFDCLLEIDSKVMEQLLAVRYLFKRSRDIEDWIDRVLSRGFLEVQRSYNLTAHSVVRLAACKGIPDEQTPGVCLPQNIIVN